MPKYYLSVLFVAVSFLALSSLPAKAQTNGVGGTNGDPGQNGTDGAIGTAEVISGTTQQTVTGEDGGTGGSGGNGVDENGDGNAAGGNGGNGGDGRSVTFAPETVVALSDDRIFLRATGGDGGNAGGGGTSVGNGLAGVAGTAGNGGNATVVGNAMFSLPDPVDLTATAIGGDGGFGVDSFGGNANATAIASGTALLANGVAEAGDGRSSFGSEGTAGDGGDATSVASLVTAVDFFDPLDSATVISQASGGDGGSVNNADGIGGNGGDAVATGSVLSQDTRGGVFVSASGGNGGNGQLAGGNAGSAILENAASGGTFGLLEISQSASGGGAGRVVGTSPTGVVGIQGQSGDGISRLTSNDVNQIGGDSRVTVSATGGALGGDGIASANVRDTGEIELTVNATAGTATGQVVIESAVAESTGGDVIVRATATGARAVATGGGFLTGPVIPANGGSVTLDNVVAGSSPTDLFLGQTAEGGRGDGGGLDGDAFSRIQLQRSATEEFAATSNAEGHNATAINDIENLTGEASSGATAEAEGVAIASAIARGNADQGGLLSFGAEARSIATGHNVTASSLAIQTGSDRDGRTSAFVDATGTGDNNIVTGSTRSIATVGNASATTNVTGETATGTAHAESQVSASSTLFIRGETGGRDGDNGSDGGTIANSALATGSAGVRLSTTTALQAGGGGSASNSGVAGNGGDASLDFSSDQLNPGGGDTFFNAQIISGGGGSHDGDGDGGRAGNSDLRLNLVADTASSIDLSTQSTSGSGGDATESRFDGGSPLGNGGDAGDATANLSVTSDFGGDISINSRQFAFNGGGAIDGRAGDGGDASGTVLARSSGGSVLIDNAATSGAGGDTSGSGQTGDAGVAFSDVTAISAGGDAQAISSADGGSAGRVSSGNGTVGNDFLTTATALADGTIRGSGSGGFAQAQATASGSNIESLSIARTGNNAFRNIEVRASGSQGNTVETQARAQIGGTTPAFFNSDAIPLEAHGSFIANPDVIFVPNGDSIRGSFLDEFQADNIRDTDFVLANGLIGASYSRDADGSDVFERTVEIVFDIAIESTVDDLVLGFYSPDADSTGLSVFDSLLLTVDIDGLYSESFSFVDRETADDFFSFQTLSLGSLEGFDRVGGSIRIDYVASETFESYRFNYLLGNAQANLNAIAIPEPSAFGALLALAALHLSRRRRARALA